MTTDLTTNPDLTLLLELSELFTSLELDDFLQRMMKLVTRAVGATKSSLLLYKEGRIDWQYIINISDNKPDQTPKTVQRILDKGLAGWVAKNRKMALVPDTRHDARWFATESSASIRAALCLPLLYKGDLVAVMTVVHDVPGYFTDHHVQLLTIITNQAATAINNARMYAQAQTQHRQFEAMLWAFPDMLLVMDDVGRIIVANDSILPMLGCEKRQEVLGARLTDMPKRDTCLDSVCELLYQKLDKKTGDMNFEVHSKVLQADYQVTVSRWENPNRSANGFVIVLHDVTKIRDLHRFKDEMLRLASHDLRSPLAFIVGYADMITLDMPEGESPIPSYVDSILRSARRMDNLLEDMLRIEQIRTSPLELHEEVVPRELVDLAVQNSQPQAEAKQIQFTMDANYSDDRVYVVADRVLIRQAMENLIGNALKYTFPSGKVTTYAKVDDDRFHFIVTDNGIGIPQDKLAYVFESFYRVPNAKGIQGTGLGLSLVRNVVEQHKGQVWVNSEENEGSTFGFWLPIIRKEKAIDPEQFVLEIIQEADDEEETAPAPPREAKTGT